MSAARLSIFVAFLANLSGMRTIPATSACGSAPLSAVRGQGLAVWQRILASTAIGVASALLCRALMRHLNLGAADFSYALREGRELLAGRDPYDIFPGATAYSLPAAILALPSCDSVPETAGLTPQH